MSQNTIWEINGVSLTLDLADADVMERYETAFDKMAEEEKQLPKDGKQSERIRAYCKLYRNMYDRIFGDGASGKIFMDQPDNASAYDEVYDNFLSFIRTQLVGTAEKRAERLNKYRPNRAQKRAVNKKK